MRLKRELFNKNLYQDIDYSNIVKLYLLLININYSQIEILCQMIIKFILLNLNSFHLAIDPLWSLIFFVCINSLKFLCYK